MAEMPFRTQNERTRPAETAFYSNRLEGLLPSV
jgi:hypothetical protein